MHRFHIPLNTTCSLSNRQRSGPRQRFEKIPALRRQRLPEQGRRFKADKRAFRLAYSIAGQLPVNLFPVATPNITVFIFASPAIDITPKSAIASGVVKLSISTSPICL
jgi:hypothetical protein